MSRLVEALFMILNFMLVALLVGMVVLVFGNVVLRYAFNSGIPVSEELARWFFVWLVFLGAVIGMRTRAHLAVTMGVLRLPPLARRAALFVSTLLMLGCAGLVAHGSWLQMMINWDTLSPAARLSTAWFYGAGLAIGVLAIPMLVWDLRLILDTSVDEMTLLSLRGSEDEELK